MDTTFRNGSLQPAKEPAVTFVIGPSCSGKTTWIRENLEVGAFCLYPGQEFRKNPELVTQFVGSSNPYAPPEVDEAIIRMCRRFILEHPEAEVVIDGTPRNELQWKEIVMWAVNQGRRVVLVDITCDFHIRLERIRGRGDQKDRELSLARMPHEEASIWEMKHLAAEHGIPNYTVRTD